MEIIPHGTIGPDETNEHAIDHLMDTRGLSRWAAEAELGINDAPITPLVTRQESKRLHPSGYRGRPPVGEDSEDVMTGILSPEQVETNRRGAASVRQALEDARRAAGTYDDSVEAQARRRAKEERRGY